MKHTLRNCNLFLSTSVTQGRQVRAYCIRRCAVPRRLCSCIRQIGFHCHAVDSERAQLSASGLSSKSPSTLHSLSARHVYTERPPSLRSALQPVQLCMCDVLTMEYAAERIELIEGTAVSSLWVHPLSYHVFFVKYMFFVIGLC